MPRERLSVASGSTAEVSSFYRHPHIERDGLWAIDLWYRGSRNAAATLDDVGAALDWPDDELPARSHTRRHHREWGSGADLSYEELYELASALNRWPRYAKGPPAEARGPSHATT